MTLIGLISDVHATAAPVREALSHFRCAGVDQILCAGDIAGYHDEVEETVALLVDHKVQAVRGNHDLRYLERHGGDAEDRAADYFRQLPAVIDIEVAGKRVYVVHAEPPDACTGGGIRLLDQDGGVRPERAGLWARQLAGCDCDVLVVGHSHQVFAERLGTTLVVNPGSTVFNHACAILQLPEMIVQVLPLSGQAVCRNWNWAEFMADRGSPA
ncbi:MAG TPA: metallophosphoesterase family protein [Gammaproteobacteria bacterium]|nr:metallophosphoesterase family protein [Gammaproteobacteria bacterium]